MRVGIVGGSGYTGGELLRILAKHEKCSIELVTSQRFVDKPVWKVHGNLRKIYDLKFENPSIDEIAKRCDFVFFATPTGVAMRYAKELLDAGIKIVDLSADFRLKDVKTFEKYYKISHLARDIKAPYGLPEINREEIRRANIVANPGCYPTCVIIPLAPLLKEDLIKSIIIVDAKSGISGAGARPSEFTHFPNVHENVVPYKITTHRHVPEMEQELRKFKSDVKIYFTPQVVPITRGMLATIHCFLKEKLDSNHVKETLEKYYKNEPFVRILDIGEIPRITSVRGTNYIDIGGFEIDRDRLVIISAIDNLVKGASGQAVQNMNIMMKFDEKMGLKDIGISP